MMLEHDKHFEVINITSAKKSVSMAANGTNKQRKIAANDSKELMKKKNASKKK